MFSLQLASTLLGDFPDGAFFIALSPISDPALVASTVAQSLGLLEVKDTSLVDSIKNHLRDKQLLIILDNFEQVLDAAPLVSWIMLGAPGVKVLVTSREKLHIRGEHEFSVPTMALPDPERLPPIYTLIQYEAVRLFIDRATATRGDFQVNNENALAVTEICARLDGLPLAIELAAVRIKMLSPQSMLTRLQSRLRLLMGGYVACALALSHPERVRSIATLGTKFYWDRETAEREVAILDPAKITAKVPHFARALAERHVASGWEAVLSSTANLLLSLGESGGLRSDHLAPITCPVRVMVGDRDSTVGVPEAYEVYRALPKGELEVLPGTRHELERVDMAGLVGAMMGFFR